jgi:hypothetical protein
VKIIPLTRGYVAWVDDQDYAALVRFKWCAYVSKSGKVYAQRGVYIGSKQSTIYMHREILKTVGRIDHRNGDGCDNRRKNLRPATCQQNYRGHQSPRKGKTSLYRGVCRCSRTGRWRAQIGLGRGRVLGLGYFLTQTSAAKAYDAAALEHFGRFAAPNFKQK